MSRKSSGPHDPHHEAVRPLTQGPIPWRGTLQDIMNTEQTVASAEAGDTENSSFDHALGLLNDQEETTPPAEPEPSEDEPEVEEAETAEADEAEATPEPDDEPDEEILHGNHKTRLRDGTVVAIADLKKAYDEAKEYRAKQSDYEAKAKEFETQKAAITQQEQFFTQTLQHAKTVLEASMPPEPDEALREADPIEYFLRKDARDRKILEWRRLDHAQKVQAQKAEAERTEHVRTQVAREMELLKDAIPELKTEEGFKAFKDDVLTYAPREYGFTPQELAELSDHRALRVIKDAIAYRKLQSNKAKVAEKVKHAPPVTVTPPGRRTGNDEARAAKVKSGFEKLRSTGSFDDALSILNSES
jgi:hypothetical protein